jgi:hypothetical protein
VEIFGKLDDNVHDECANQEGDHGFPDFAASKYSSSSVVPFTGVVRRSRSGDQQTSSAVHERAFADENQASSAGDV